MSDEAFEVAQGMASVNPIVNVFKVRKSDLPRVPPPVRLGKYRAGHAVPHHATSPLQGEVFESKKKEYFESFHPKAQSPLPRDSTLHIIAQTPASWNPRCISMPPRPRLCCHATQG